ncbi:NAD(P)H-dependent oxidoreductase [Paenibacillus sp. YYML68]|uniref:NAD(P)H-dependent oxidoreductase n=1 Tax=Paenibacillus sp. YYML68 TaxID=2909250 RepID=UPI002492826A|nr:NAD(P)H-dependent oxidoreductase [Paenibacillus sp. YYML68]
MNILIINGHPDQSSFCAALTASYMEGAASGGAKVRRLDVGQLAFDPNLKHGYSQRTELEPDLVQAQELIRWADHLVFVYPTWWGTPPAILKGFIDRVFLPGFAFKHREGSLLWDKLLSGKSARLIVTSDTPAWYDRFIYKNAGHSIMKRNILGFCGVKPVRVTPIGPVRPSTEAHRAKWLSEVKALGARRG